MPKLDKIPDNEILDLYNESVKNIIMDDADQELDMPTISINMEEIDVESQRMSKLITERLSDYYFSKEYIDEHPYIPTKIMLVMNNIRRLLKMLSVNEKAQDSLILGVSYNIGKGSLYGSLTALQNAMLSIQNQLNHLVTELEEIFSKMQAECDKTFKEKDLEKQSDGTIIVRGARELIQEIENMQKSGKIGDKVKLEEIKKSPEEMSAEELDNDLSLDDLIEK
ncbi:MAG: hypothetical protein J1F35_06175 [Erysipelotrichales bacterium]|nr:hypothetical protein [Erysipelotrichales bacterium]